MTTPFILGNDFADQYFLSVKQMQGRAFLEFGDSGQSLDIANLVSPNFINEEGHAFWVQRISSTSTGLSKKIYHWRNQRIRRKTKFQATDQNVRTGNGQLPEKYTSLCVEKMFTSSLNLEDIYMPDLLINKWNAVLQVSSVTAFLNQFWYCRK